MIEAAPGERDALLAYFAAEGGDVVVRMEKVAFELVGPVAHAVWDVHCRDSRWWVISEPLTWPSSSDGTDKRPAAPGWQVGFAVRVTTEEGPDLAGPARGQCVDSTSTSLCSTPDQRVIDHGRVEGQEGRGATRSSRGLAETLQRHLLTAPPQRDGLRVAVRYQPAGQEEQIGGDWYDAFLTPDGSTTLVIGDVAGHDQAAAAVMAQVRNVLRGVAQILEQPPAAVLAGLDRALHCLQIDALATAVVCQLADPDASGGRRLRWSNAGHPPPLLLQPDGTAQLLRREADLLLGLQPDSPRADHQVDLPPGAALVLYTDGLVERRGQSIDDGLERLREIATQLWPLPAEQLSDALLDQLAGDAEDDVALLVLHTPAEQPEPARRDDPLRPG